MRKPLHHREAAIAQIVFTCSSVIFLLIRRPLTRRPYVDASLVQPPDELFGRKLSLAQDARQGAPLHLTVKRDDAGIVRSPKFYMTSLLGRTLEAQAFEHADDIGARKGRKLRHAP